MPFPILLQNLIWITFHEGVAVSIVATIIERFFPDQFIATQDAVKGFLLSVTAALSPDTLRHITMDKIIGVVPVTTTKAFDNGYDFINYLLSKGATFIYSLQSFSWLELVNGAEYFVQSLMSWLPTLKWVISTVGGLNQCRKRLIDTGQCTRYRQKKIKYTGKIHDGNGCKACQTDLFDEFRALYNQKNGWDKTTRTSVTLPPFC